MTTRAHSHEERFDVDSGRLFRALHTAEEIRGWWGAARAIVVARRDGVWAAAWGDSENDPDYVTAARIAEFEPPRRMLLTDYRYWARTGAPPFDASFVTEFIVEPDGAGIILRVRQDGFPSGPEGDEFLAGCAVGWKDTFVGLRRHLAEDGGTQ